MEYTKLAEYQSTCSIAHAQMRSRDQNNNNKRNNGCNGEIEGGVGGGRETGESGLG